MHCLLIPEIKSFFRNILSFSLVLRDKTLLQKKYPFLLTFDMKIFYIKIHQNIPEEHSPSSPSFNRFTPTTSPRILLHHPSKLGVALRWYADSFWPSKEIENWISGSLIEHKVTAYTLYRRFQHCNQGGRTWQAFGGGKNGHETFRQACIYHFRDKCVSFCA